MVLCLNFAKFPELRNKDQYYMGICGIGHLVDSLMFLTFRMPACSTLHCLPTRREYAERRKHKAKVDVNHEISRL
jgi:hypothetical protein